MQWKCKWWKWKRSKTIGASEIPISFWRQSIYRRNTFIQNQNRQIRNGYMQPNPPFLMFRCLVSYAFIFINKLMQCENCFWITKLFTWTLDWRKTGGFDIKLKRRGILFDWKSFCLDCKEKWKIRLIASIFHLQHHYLIKTRIPFIFFWTSHTDRPIPVHWIFFVVAKSGLKFDMFLLFCMKCSMKDMS